MPIIDVDYIYEDLVKEAGDDLKSVNHLKVDIGGKQIVLKYANQDLVKRLMATSHDTNKDKFQVINGNSDVIVDQYEGGFKLWEGLYDLIKYISTQNQLGQLADKKPINILELGCGSGLASIELASHLPAATFYLQDFNEDVIRYFTAANVLLNNQMSSSELNSRYIYLSGDWSDVNRDISAMNVKFDLIISSETLYNSENYPKFVALIESSLSTEGFVYIASKSHYFGVGGGSYGFIEFVESQSRLECDICHEIDAPLVRHILKLKLKPETE